MFHFINNLILFFLLVFFNFSISAGIKEAKKAFAGKQYQKAIKLFSEYAKENPSDGEPYMFMGYIHESEKDFPKSISMFRRAVDLKLIPKYKKTSLVKILLYYQYTGNWDLVSHYSNRLLKIDPSHREAQKMSHRASENNGSDPGNVRVSSEDPVKKKPSVEKIIKEEPTRKEEKAVEPEVSKQTEEEKKWETCLYYFNKEEYKKAEAVLKDLINVHPTNKNYLYKAGMAKLRLGEYQKAIEYFESSKKFSDEINDKQLLYYLNLNQGQAEQKLGNPYPALFLFNKAYEYKPNIVPLIPIARLNYENRDYAYALKISEEILKKDSQNKEGQIYRALSQIQSGNKIRGYKNLFQFMKNLKKQFPDSAKIPEKYHEAILHLGIFYSNRTKYKLASEYLSIAQNSRGKNKKFIFAFGKTYFYTGKFDLAKKYLEKLPEISAANYLLSKIYAKRSDLEKSKEFLLIAAKIKPIYWIKPKIDNYFKDFLKNPEFVSFLDYKGKPPVIVVQPIETKIEKPLEEKLIEEKPVEEMKPNLEVIPN
jgi:tetratricopeptide (TPR) repeat protein